MAEKRLSNFSDPSSFDFKLPSTPFVHVTLAILNKPGSFFTSEEGNGFIISGWKIHMSSAVFCGKVLSTQVHQVFLACPNKYSRKATIINLAM